MFGPDHSCPMLWRNSLCQNPWIPAEKEQETKTYLLDICHLTMIPNDNFYSEQSGVSPRAAPSHTLHAKLQYEESQACKHPLSYASQKDSCLSSAGAPKDLLSSLFSDQKGHSTSSSTFYFVCEWFCVFVCFVNVCLFLFLWKHFLAKQEWFLRSLYEIC